MEDGIFEQRTDLSKLNAAVEPDKSYAGQNHCRAAR